MTRENKLALVVGFGLILFVGILISDHFSIARSQMSADLGNVADPLAAQRGADADLIDLRPQPPAATQPAARQLAANPTTIMTGPSPVTGEGASDAAPMRMNEQPGADLAQLLARGLPEMSAELPGFVRLPSSAGGEAAQEIRLTPAIMKQLAAEANVKWHEVRGGESLFAICRQHFGDTSLVRSLAKFNNIDDPDSVRAGQRLKIPTAQELGGRTTASPANAPPKQPVTYIVKAGDSLSLIAQRTLGDRNKWRKLYEMNKDVIDEWGGPDNLRVGTVLRLLS